VELNVFLIMILCIETSSTVCSVALFSQRKLVALEESFIAKNHSSVIIPMLDQLMEKAAVSYEQLKAVAISSGPGSYTGLRIGVSTAKGFCDALSIPLISVPTLQAIAKGFLHSSDITQGFVCPMFDARRMEVYYWLGDADGNEVHEVAPLVLDENAFEEELNKEQVYFVGEGSKKASGVLKHHNAVFEPDFSPSARWLGLIAQEKFAKGLFEDLAYFEPFYLKETVITAKKSS